MAFCFFTHSSLDMFLDKVRPDEAKLKTVTACDPTSPDLAALEDVVRVYSIVEAFVQALPEMIAWVFILEHLLLLGCCAAPAYVNEMLLLATVATLLKLRVWLFAVSVACVFLSLVPLPCLDRLVSTALSQATYSPFLRVCPPTLADVLGGIMAERAGLRGAPLPAPAPPALQAPAACPTSAGACTDAACPALHCT
eukprot:CAMPEP_0177671680 /NCGR_PEP_ID=MMETSP0447-20121125/24867_1 /TAXON_ID=0 /ORGANISM="Stygamoeba regulata, Strain BSH-02190019" /LENGTH=195 /DNA_ID=CAMNT_0019179157 /DNA_START=322 /DNA_END=905 /DNA_ORIENTATION=+